MDTVVLDKTGTVTTGRMSLVDVLPAPGVDRDEALRLAGALEAASEHPIARAIAAAAPAVGPHPPSRSSGTSRDAGWKASSSTAASPPVGVSSSTTFPLELELACREAEGAGRTAIVAGWAGVASAVFIVADAIKPTSADAVTSPRPWPPPRPLHR